MKRASGVLLPVASLPSKYGIGCFSREAYEWIDYLKGAGQSYWQILPLAPTSYGDSPYQSFSSFAGNPYFIDLEELIQEGLLTREECEEADFGSEERSIDYGKIHENRLPLLRVAYGRSEIWKDPEFQKFVEENAYWLDDYALFMAVKQRFNGAPWSEWAEDIRKRWGYALDYYRRECYFDIEFYKFLQFLFRKQWKKLKDYANENGIEIIGDIPIYVAFDSSDAWASPEMFQFDEDFQPLAVAGCPPDAFSADGQLWGNPLYRWDYHRQTGYEWWCRRIDYCFQLYDVVRIDHFRGFDEYYSIPYGDKTARGGHWEKGPGIELFRTLNARLGNRPGAAWGSGSEDWSGNGSGARPEAMQIIAEDLGFLTPSVTKLLKDSGYPGMKVLEFAFDPREETDYLPHSYDRNCVVYTGTHDNETLVQWYKGLDEGSRAFAEEYMDDAHTPFDKRYWDFVRLAMMSSANTCIIPIQDYLGLDEEARINHPSTLGGNWTWRLDFSFLTAEMSEKIFRLTKISARMSDFMKRLEEKKRQEAAEAARKAQEEAEAARKAQEEAEAARKAQEEAEAARKAQEEAEAARKAQEEAEAARKAQEAAAYMTSEGNDSEALEGSREKGIKSL